MIKRMFPLLVAAALCSAQAGTIAYAEENEISSVELSFSRETAPRAGERAGGFWASCSDRRVIVEGSEYLKKDELWIYGEQPEAEVALSAAEGYRFSEDISRNSLTLHGCGAQFDSVSVEDDGCTLILQLTFPQIGGTLPATTSASWTGTSASWDEVGGAGLYTVDLYRNNRLVASVTTSETSYSFEEEVSGEGSYVFSVQAKNSEGGAAGPWVSCPEPLVVMGE